MNSGRPETMENLPALYTIFQGEVAMVTDYGAFIKIPGCRKQGLVHRTHMSSCRVDKPSEIVDVGDKVWVKLIGREMKNDRIKVSLSMKVVNQGTGKDLDPNNVIIEQEERRRRSFQDYTGQKITLEAVLNTTCKKCGCKGHFAKDCFMQPGGTKYSLIPDEEEEKEEAKSAEFEKPDPTRNSSRKRKKIVLNLSVVGKRSCLTEFCLPCTTCHRTIHKTDTIVVQEEPVHLSHATQRGNEKKLCCNLVRK
ncbi:zinc finger CCHC domain-containing protein 17 isoform X4 [Panthera onca]|uniref:zinc finger CCHC domain-containing protein 17 isoform X5 n=1 Tax=Panthera onca TaxID=9690 RepID=UPI0029542881|nr:zinc finger CCHC domain-containing protein 17 isoform X5 [Panthera onca]